MSSIKVGDKVQWTHMYRRKGLNFVTWEGKVILVGQAWITVRRRGKDHRLAKCKVRPVGRQSELTDAVKEMADEG